MLGLRVCGMVTEMRKAAVPSDASWARGARVERLGQSRGGRVEQTGCWSSGWECSEQKHESRIICGDMMQSSDANGEAALRGGKHTRGCQCDGSFSASRRCRRGLPIANINSRRRRWDGRAVTNSIEVGSSVRASSALTASRRRMDGWPWRDCGG